MLDLIFFVFGVAVQSSGGGGDTDVTAIDLSDPAAIEAETAAPATEMDMAESAPEVEDLAEAAPAAEDLAESAPETDTMAEITMDDSASDTATEEVMASDTETMNTESAAEDAATEEAEAMVAEAKPADTAEPEGGSWNISTTSDGSWITNAPEDGGGGDTSWISNAPSELDEDTAATNTGAGTLLAGVVNEDDTTPTASVFTAEPQIPTGKFTTATEVKPILDATKGSWVAVRDYEGQDWIYVTHIWAWRCGLHQMRYSINGGPMQVWPLPPCHEGTASPNAIIESDGLPYDTYSSGEIQTIKVELLLDDMSEASASYIRSDVLMP